MKHVLLVIAALLSLVQSDFVQGQTPNVTNETPPEHFLGEQFCFDAAFTNTGSPGFGPYFQLILPPNLTFDSATIFGSSTIIQNVGIFPATPGNQLTDPISNTPVTGPDGGTLTTVALPIGSVVTAGPDLVTEVCLTIKPTATAGVPLNVSLVPAYQFGDTATGTNGPIVAGTPNTKPVTPIIIRLEKTNTAPESERPPTSSWPFDYVLTADIANTVTIDNLVFNDILPATVQFVGPISVAGGNNCVATSTPSTINPGGTVTVSCDSAVGTTVDDDVVVSFPVHFTDMLVSNSCANSLISNTATLDIDYKQVTQPQLTSDTEVTAKHLALQKGASPGLAIPGNVITYTLAFQVDDIEDLNNLVVTDTLPDGFTFTAHGGMSVGSNPVSIAPSVTANVDGTTTVVYDISAVVTGNIPAGSTIQISYTATIDQDYVTPAMPVHAGDSLSNTVSASYGTTAGASACTEGSGAEIEIVPVNTSKVIVNPQSFYVPGESVTFRLTLNVPSGDTREIVMVDTLPLPVFKVADIGTTWGTHINFGPDSTITQAPPIGSITTNAALNELRIEWPDIDSTTPQVLQVDVVATVTSDPFADGLFLTNILSVDTENSKDQGSNSQAIAQLKVGAPSLLVTKGVSNSTNSTSTIAPAATVLPIDGDLTNGDAGDQITYVITVENIGSAMAYEVLIQDEVPAGLTACALVSVKNGSGIDLTHNGGDLFTAGLLLDNPLSANDANPAGGGAPFTTDTALVTFTCDIASNVNPTQKITNTASADWSSQSGATKFTSNKDTATVDIANVVPSKLLVATSEASTSDASNPPRVTIGEVVRYRLAVRIPEGTITDLKLVDTLPAGLAFLNDGTVRAAFVSNGTGLTSSTVSGIPNINGNSASLANVPSSALTYSFTNFTASSDTYTFSLGNVVNGDNDDDAEFLIVEFNALVLNVAGNNAGNNRVNSFQVLQGNTLLATSGNRRIRISEPLLTVDKTANPTIGDAGDLISYTLVLTNSVYDDATTAFDAVLSDVVSPLLNNVAVQSITPSAGCSGITDNSAGNNISIVVSTMAPACNVTVTYTANLDNAVAPGTSISNTAFAHWTSLPGGSGSSANPTGSSTPGASGTAQGERNGTGGVNDYVAEGSAKVDIRAVSLTKVITGTSQASTGTGQVRPAVEDLTIGETVDFEIVATIPEGTAPQVIISDVVPYTNGVMEILSATIVSVGANLTTEKSPDSPASLLDTQLSDGINDSAVFDFGEVSNPANGAPEAARQIKIAITAVLRDLPANTSLDQLKNTASVQFGTGLNATATADMDVVEPLMTIDKGGDVTQGDAGDEVTFTLTINHANASTADAFDVVLSDTLPTKMTLVGGSLSHVSGPLPTLSEVGNGIEAKWNTVQLGALPTVLSFKATINNNATPAEVITNKAELHWSSLPGDGDPNDRVRNADDSHSLTITSPGITKVITGTSVDGTGSDQFGDEVDLTIGEHVTYQFTVVIPEGLSENAKAWDLLPTGSSIFSVVSSRLVSIGDNLSGTGLVLNAPGMASDTNSDTFNDRVDWDLGAISNAPDGEDNQKDWLVFEVVAVVVDMPVNQSGVVDQINTASFSTSNTSISGTVAVDIVAPQLSMEKLIAAPDPAVVDAGDTVSYELTIKHTPDSTAGAYSLLVTETLPDPALQWGGDLEVDSTCAGWTVDSSGSPIVIFEIPALSLADESCTINYKTIVDVSAGPGDQIVNSAALQYDSTPDFTEGETRRKTTTAFDEAIVDGPSFVKLTVASSLPDTNSDQGNPLYRDITIGETVTYELTIHFSEGTTTNAIVTDLLPASDSEGYMEVVGAHVSFMGSNITTSEPGTPVIDDFQGEGGPDGINDRVILDFGTVTNVPDNISDRNDNIVISIVARVIDVPENNGGDELINAAIFEFGNQESLADSATIDVVEPVLSLSKNMGPISNGKVRITLAIENTGTAPAYDINVTDLLDDTVWDSASLNIISLSTGFDLETAPGPNAGETALTFSTDPLAVSPVGSIPVGSSVTAVFELDLAQLPPVPNPVVNVAVLDKADTLPGPDEHARDLPPLEAQDEIGVPDLLVSKAADLHIDLDDNSVVSPADTLRYTLVVRNQGVADATNVELNDIPDGNSSLVVGSVTTTQGSVATGNTAGDASIKVNIGTIPPQGSVTISYDTAVNSPLPAGVTELVNQAVVNSTELPPIDSDDPDEPGTDDPTIVPVFAAPDLVISKDDGNDESAAGDTVIYTLTYRNVGNQDATGTTITETVPAHSSFNAANSASGWACNPNGNAGSVCTLAIGAVAAGDPSASVAFAVTIDNPLAAGVEQLFNTASIADDGSNGADPTPDNNEDTDTNTLLAAPDLVIAKDDGDITAKPGDTVVYTLSYRNVGDQDATGVVITETVPANARFNSAASTTGWNCSPDATAGSVCTLDIGAVSAAAGTASVTFAVTVDKPLPAGITQISNSASIADDGDNGPDPTPDNNRDDDVTPVEAQPDLVIRKDDGGVRTEPGGTVAYTLSYQNVGDQNATGVVITETVPANSSFNLAASSPGWVCGSDGSAGSVCTLDIGDLVAGAAAVNVIFAVTVVDPLPAGVDELFNTSRIADDGSNGDDPTPENNVDADTTPIDAVPDLLIAKDDGDVTAVPGDTVTYVLSYQNVGNQDATGVKITETVPANSSFNAGASTTGWACDPDANAGSVCTLAIGDVAAGASLATAAFAVDVVDPLPSGVVELLNTTSIADDGTNGEDPTPDDNSDTDNTPVEAQPDLVITKDDGGIEAAPGEVVLYTLSYQNVGNQDAVGVVITETVPLNSSFDTFASSPGWVCTPDSTAGASCTLEIGAVGAGDPVATAAFAVVVDKPLASGVEEIRNTARIADDGTNGDDPTPDNNRDDDTTPVNAAPDLVITKVDTGETVAPGDVLPYTLTYQNVGDQNATGVVITEIVPDFTTFEADSSEPGWVCTPDISAGSTCTLDRGAVVAGADPVMLVFAVRLVTPWQVGVEQISNTAIIADDGTNGDDPTPDNNTDTVITEVGGPATFRVSKDFTDNNPMKVEANLSCTTGLILDQSKLIAEGDAVTFVMTAFTPANLNCEINETVPNGYTPTYQAIDDPEGSAIRVYEDENGCYFEGVSFGAYECRITNTPLPVPVVIEKQWLFNSSNMSGVDTRYELVLYCDSQIIDNDPACPPEADGPNGSVSPTRWCKRFTGSADQVFTAEVIPDYPTTQCHVNERVLDPAVEVDNGCMNLEVSAGQGDRCVVVNTVFFEGIPTLNPYGLALLAMLMLGMGFVGVRRTV